MDKLVVTAARRTPIGSFLGSLAEVSAADLGVTVARAVLEGVNGNDVADVIVGNVLQAGQGMNVARQVAVKSGLPQHVPGLTVNRVCGSGLQAVISAAQGLRSGDGKLYLAGGTENMSRSPYLLPRARQGYRLGHGQIVDSMLSEGLTDAFHDVHMGITAENIAAQWGIGREEQDAFAVETQARTAHATESGAFRAEIVPVEVPGKKGPTSSTPTSTRAPRAWKPSPS